MPHGHGITEWQGRGRVRQLQLEAVTSGRRLEAWGAAWATFVHFRIGVCPDHSWRTCAICWSTQPCSSHAVGSHAVLPVILMLCFLPCRSVLNDSMLSQATITGFRYS
jgi:hypothetical protein